MTPIALLTFGFFAFFLFRYRRIIPLVLWDVLTHRRLRKLHARPRRKAKVQFFTADEVWEEPNERKSA